MGRVIEMAKHEVETGRMARVHAVSVGSGEFPAVLDIAKPHTEAAQRTLGALETELRRMG